MALSLASSVSTATDGAHTDENTDIMIVREKA